MNRFRIVLLVCILIILALVGRLALEERAIMAAAQAELDYARTAKRDLLALMLAYPQQIQTIRRGDDGLIYAGMQSGDEILYDDMKEKNFDGQLASADLQDMMAEGYPLNAIDALMEDNCDPGRIRCYAFFHAIYGNTKYDIEQHLTNTNLISGSYPVAANAAPALENAMKQLADFVREDPSAYGDVFPLNGTYNYRFIAGTTQLSPHAFGIAIDFCSRPGDYWRWATAEQGQSRLDDYPEDVVQIMEDSGFIWGGKWAHFDFLHYEYRPELILKARYASDDAQFWYAGFPQDAKTQEYVEMIEEAFITG